MVLYRARTRSLIITRLSIMASLEVAGTKRDLQSAEYPRKRLRIADLPLSASQRSAIDGLVHTIKKKGIYDTLRKQVWSQFNESVRVQSVN